MNGRRHLIGDRRDDGKRGRHILAWMGGRVEAGKGEEFPALQTEVVGLLPPLTRNARPLVEPIRGHETPSEPQGVTEDLPPDHKIGTNMGRGNLTVPARRWSETPARRQESAAPIGRDDDGKELGRGDLVSAQ